MVHKKSQNYDLYKFLAQSWRELSYYHYYSEMTSYTIDLFIFLFLFLSFAYMSKANKKKCSYDNHPNQPEVYYINLKKSENRRKSVEQLLTLMQLRYFRIDGVTFNSAYVPNDFIQSKSDKPFRDICKYKTNETIDNSIQAMIETNKTHLVQGLCTRDTKWTELYCSISHLQAIYQAVHSTTATSKYALIMEDDVYIPFSIDYNALAESAPSDFGILQLMTVSRQLLR